MTEAISLEYTDATADVIRRAFPGYRGRKFQMTVSSSVTIQDTSWDGGSRSTYRMLELASGRSSGLDLRTAQPADWLPSIEGTHIHLRPGFAVINWVIFCGKDLGLYATVHPDDAAPMLPVPADPTLDDDALQILAHLSQLRSCPERKAAIATLGGDTALDALAVSGHVKRSRNGATKVTVKGRNAARHIRIR